jgi:hypothetical protein
MRKRDSRVIERRWVAKLIERLPVQQLSGFESRYLSKIKMGDISKGVANTL